MIFLDELKDLTLYKKPFYLPISEDHKKKGSAVFLLTPNYESSKNCMRMPYMINNKLFESFYMERDVNYYITKEGQCIYDNPGRYLHEEAFEDESVLNEEFGQRIKTVSGIFLSDDKTKVLVEKHKRTGKYNFPSGKVDSGETEEQALIREMQEELGIKITGYKKLYTFSFAYSYNDDDSYYITDDTSYMITSYEGKIENKEKEKHEFVDFIALNQLKQFPNLSYTIQRFLSGLSFKRDDYGKSVFKKMGTILFSGYEKDVIPVRNLITSQKIKELSRQLGIEYKNHDRFVNITGYDNGYDYIDDRTITILSRDVYTSSYENDYSSYINTCLTIHVYRCYNPMVDDRIVYPLALYKMGIKDKKYHHMIRIFEEIETQYGYHELLRIVKSNDYRLLLNYAAKLTLSKYISEDVDLSDPTKLSAHIKRSMRKGSKYELNRVEREVKRTLDPNEQTPDTYSSETIQKESLIRLLDEGSYIESDHSIMILNEKNNNDTLLKGILYQDRIKTSKELLEIYERVKQENPFIKYTYTDLSKYNGKNVFVDLSYYNEIYFRNSMYESLRGLNLYLDLMNRLINDKQYNTNYKKKTIFIPILDWNVGTGTKMWIYREDINPISIIYQLIKTNPSKISSIFKDMDVVFLGAKNYFKINFSHFTKQNEMTRLTNQFLVLIQRILKLGYDSPAEPDPIDEPENSPKGITMAIVDKIETSQGIKIDKIAVPETKKKSVIVKPVTPPTPTVKKTTVEDKKKVTKIDVDKSKDVVNTIDTEKKKEDLVKAISQAASDSADEDDTLEKLDNERIKQLLIDLAGEESDQVKLNAARSSRAIKLQNQLLDKQVKGKSIKDLLAVNPDEMSLPTTTLNVSTPNDEWKEMKFMNFDRKYDVDSDIVKMLNSMKDWSRPVFIRNIKVEDNSTSEDYLDLYTVECEDARGTRFTLKFDIPKFEENRYMILRGNKKTLLIQSFLLPIIKTDLDTCQIISNYNKIFVKRFGTTAGKSNVISDRIVKTLKKLKDNQIKVTYGDNTRVCAKYELPMDYIDLASVYDRLEMKNCTIYFNQDELRKEYEVDDNLGIPYGIKQADGKKQIMYYNSGGSSNLLFSFFLYNDLSEQLGQEFTDVFNKTSNSVKYTYSRTNIMNSEIPLIVLCAYSEGLTKVMEKAGIQFTYAEKIDRGTKSSFTYDFIRFNDGYIIYEVDYNSSLLMNGLKECDTAGYSIKEINSKSMYLDFLDNYGGRIISDGLDAFYDCMIDPITKEILEKYNLPTDYVSVLLYANTLLSDNKYVKHTKMDGRRFRRGELIAGYVYKAITDSYGAYSRQLKRSRSNKITMTMKQSVIIDRVLTDTISSDTSVNNGVNDVEGANTVTNKGPSGMNTDRAYGLDKRTYDPSMLNVLGMSTGFAGNVGINRQATVDSNIEGARGFIKPIDNDQEKLNSAKSLTITEALTPYGVTSDDPFRTAMTFIQTSKHMVRTKKVSPLLVTNGADEAMPYLVSDIFAFKAKKNGKIIEVGEGKNDFYMIIEYEDGSHDFVDLNPKIEKNSDGGYSVMIEFKSDLKLGDTVKEGEVVAYDPLSFVDGSYGDSDNLDYAVGTLAKVAIINTDEGYEDSAAIDESLSEDLATDIVITKEIYLSKTTNVELLVQVGDRVNQEDTLLVSQSSYEDEDVNTLLKNLSTDAGEISELGRKPIRSKVTGDIVGIKVYRTCEYEEMSDSLKKIVSDYEKPIKAKKKIYNKYKINSRTKLPADYKLNQTGKLKNVDDGVLIVFYIRYKDIVSIGDKVVFYSANKGVVKYIFPKGEEPYTEFRPNEKLNAFVSVGSINGRMVCSTPKIGAFTKLMIELDRSVKDIAGIPYEEIL